MRIGARQIGFVVVLAAGLSCSASDESPETTAPDPRAKQAGCTQEVTRLCSEFQRAEQVACVRRELARCVQEPRPSE